MTAPGRTIFVLSSERSGSTLLRLMLGAHSALIACGELFLLRYPDFDSWRQAKPSALHSLVEFFELAGDPRGPEEICNTFRGRTTAQVYRALIECLPEGKFLVDKTPAYANELETLQKTVQFTPFYIWLTRHPLGVIYSSIRLKQQRSKPGRIHRIGKRVAERVEELTDSGMSRLARERERKWLVQQGNICCFLKDVPDQRKFRLSYEQLVSEPETYIKDLCRSLGIGFEQSMLDPFSKSPVVLPGLGDENVRTTTRIESGMAERWRSKYREQALTAQTRALMEVLGIGAGSDREIEPFTSAASRADLRK